MIFNVVRFSFVCIRYVEVARAFVPSHSPPRGVPCSLFFTTIADLANSERRRSACCVLHISLLHTHPHIFLSSCACFTIHTLIKSQFFTFLQNYYQLINSDFVIKNYNDKKKFFSIVKIKRNYDLSQCVSNRPIKHDTLQPFLFPQTKTKHSPIFRAPDHFRLLFPCLDFFYIISSAVIATKITMKNYYFVSCSIFRLYHTSVQNQTECLPPTRSGIVDSSERARAISHLSPLTTLAPFNVGPCSGRHVEEND